MSNATPVTTEVLENLTLIAAVASRACPLNVTALQVAVNVCKIQKLVVSLKKKHDPFATAEWMIEKCDELAKEIGGQFIVDDIGGNPSELVCTLRFRGADFAVW